MQGAPTNQSVNVNQETMGVDQRELVAEQHSLVQVHHTTSCSTLRSVLSDLTAAALLRQLWGSMSISKSNANREQRSVPMGGLTYSASIMACGDQL